MSVLKFSLVSNDIFISMNVAMSPSIAGVHPSLSRLGSMASKRAGSKDTNESAIGHAVEQVSMCLSIYEETKLIVDKEIKLKWQDINDTFSGTFGEDLEERRVHVNIHKSCLCRIACRYPSFPCADMTHLIVSHTDLEMMVLRNVSGTEIATFKA